MMITNQFGLFSLVVGEGLVDLGDFNKVPWIQRISGWKWQSRMKENLVFDH
jgi:hypothetical protein